MIGSSQAKYCSSLVWVSYSFPMLYGGDVMISLATLVGSARSISNESPCTRTILASGRYAESKTGSVSGSKSLRCNIYENVNCRAVIFKPRKHSPASLKPEPGRIGGGS